MFSVFSNTKKPSEIIRELSLCAGSNLNRLLFSGPEDEPLYILKPEVLNYPVNKEGLNIIEWANKNIDKAGYFTMFIRNLKEIISANV